MTTATVRTFTIVSAETMETLGRTLATALPSGCYLSLDGPLAGGKTTFARGFIRALGHSGAVKSPTFTLVETYVLEPVTVHHFDLYRLSDPGELEFIGIEDYFDAGCTTLVEWPRRGRGVLPVADIEIEFEVAGEQRLVSLRATTRTDSEIISILKIV